MMIGRLALACILAATAVTRGAASDYPDRPVRFLAPFTAGGPTDISARMIAEPLRKQLGGQTIVIENRPGASGVPGTESVALGPHDGYTILVGGIAPIVLVPIVKQLKYDVSKDFVPLGLVWRSPQVLAVRPNLDVKSVADLVAYAKANPGKVNYGSAGIGTVTHLAGELFKREAGIDLVHVPYRSTANSVVDLMGNQIDMIFGDAAIISPQIRSGAIKALAVTSLKRSILLPDLMTTAEAGFPKVQTEVWFGLFAPARTPPDILEKLKTAVLNAQKDPEYVEALKKSGTVLAPEDLGSEGFAKFIKSETERWTPIIKAVGVKF
jgi:tripartite-type tricarboxylate transporter receptor subunit TctC